MSVNACYDFLLGYSRKSDACIADDWDDSYSISDSGLYIDELPGMPQRFVASLGGNYDIWEKMANAMENAINSFKIDLLAELYKYYEPARKRFYGDVGYRTFTTTKISDTYKGLRMYSDIIGGEYVLSGFWLLMDTTETVTLEIYDDYDLLYSYSLTSSAGKPKYNAITPIRLPLGDPTQQGYNYYFLFQSAGNVYNNKLTCNCGSYKWCFNTEKPCYEYSRDQWTNWGMVAGVTGDDLTIRDDWGTSREAYGLVLHGEFNCDTVGNICDEHTDWTGNELDFAKANAIWFKTGAFLSAYVMDSEEVSRRTLLGTEQWANNMKYYNERYVAMIEFIAQNYEIGRNECLKCRDPHGYKVKSQFL